MPFRYKPLPECKPPVMFLTMSIIPGHILDANNFSKKLWTIFTLVTYLGHVLLFLSIYSAHLYWHTFWQCIAFFNMITWSIICQSGSSTILLVFLNNLLSSLNDIFSLRFGRFLPLLLQRTVLIERHFAHLQMEINTL